MLFRDLSDRSEHFRRSRRASWKRTQRKTVIKTVPRVKCYHSDIATCHSWMCSDLHRPLITRITVWRTINVSLLQYFISTRVRCCRCVVKRHDVDRCVSVGRCLFAVTYTSCCEFTITIDVTVYCIKVYHVVWSMALTLFVGCHKRHLACKNPTAASILFG